MRIKTSAPGKLMLFGEHAVVYGYPCIVTAVDLRYYATIEKIQKNEVLIDVPTTSQSVTPLKYSIQTIRNLDEYQHETSFVVAAIKHFFLKFNITSGVHLWTDGPDISYGLGSSSAITVATIAALANLFDVKLDKMGIFNLAYSAVLDVQGKGSGFDVAAATFGGTIYYKIGGEIIEPLEVDRLPIIIGYSGKKVSTTSYIKLVSELRNKHPELINGVFDLMGNIVDQAKIELTAEYWDRLGDLTDINQGLLDCLGVSTIKLNNLITAARENGAFGAKLSGAGGGDCMFGFVRPDNTEKIQKAIEHSEGYIVTVPPNAEGVRIES